MATALWKLVAYQSIKLSSLLQIPVRKCKLILFTRSLFISLDKMYRWTNELMNLLTGKLFFLKKKSKTQI